MDTIVGVIRLAWRNLRRNRKRTVLTITGLGVALIVMVMMDGLFSGITRQTIDNMIHQEQAHVRMFAAGYLDEELPGLDFLIEDADSLAARIRELSDDPVTVRMQMPATLIKGGEEVILKLRGLDVARDSRVFETLSRVEKGEGLDGTPGQALIGAKLAGDLDLGLQDRFTVLLRSAPGAMNSRRLTVTGIIRTAHPDFDARSVIISLEDARALALAPQAGTEIAMLAGHERHADDLRDRLKRAIPGYDWETWREGAENFLPMMRVKRVGTSVFIMVLALVAMIAIMNTMTMAVHERTREIGSLRAMGFTRGRILWLFLAEGLLVGLIAAVIGVVVGGGLTLWLSETGITMSQYDDVDLGMAISSTMYPALTWTTVLGTFVFGVVLGAVASWRAAWHASRGQVVRALREGML